MKPTSYSVVRAGRAAGADCPWRDSRGIIVGTALRASEGNRQIETARRVLTGNPAGFAVGPAHATQRHLPGATFCEFTELDLICYRAIERRNP